MHGGVPSGEEERKTTALYLGVGLERDAVDLAGGGLEALVRVLGSDARGDDVLVVVRVPDVK